MVKFIKLFFYGIAGKLANERTKYYIEKSKKYTHKATKSDVVSQKYIDKIIELDPRCID